MKTTKKRLLLGISGAVMLCTGAVFTTLSATAEPQITDETMLANIEALSDPEGSDGSCPTGGLANKYCPIWDITYKPGNPSESSCTTGGAYKCEKGTCPHGR